MMPSKSSKTLLPLSDSAGVMVFTYHPSPISLKPLAERRDLKLDAPSELFSFSSADGGTQSCDIWKSVRYIYCLPCAVVDIDVADVCVATMEIPSEV